MRIYNLINLVALAVLMLLVTETRAQDNPAPLTPMEQKTVVDSVGSKLNMNYVFPEVANKMVESIQNKLRNGSYKSIKDPQEFATKVTEDLQAISNDKHLRVMFAPQRIAERRQAVTPEDSIKFLNRHINRMKRNNFGFQEVKILGGNVGYLDLRSFSNVEYAGETAVSAMNSSAAEKVLALVNTYTGVFGLRIPETCGKVHV